MGSTTTGALKHGQFLTALWVAMIHASVPTATAPGARGGRASREARPLRDSVVFV